VLAFEPVSKKDQPVGTEAVVASKFCACLLETPNPVKDTCAHIRIGVKEKMMV
jgi:hypothetical protein